MVEQRDTRVLEKIYCSWAQAFGRPAWKKNRRKNVLHIDFFVKIPHEEKKINISFPPDSVPLIFRFF